MSRPTGIVFAALLTALVSPHASIYAADPEIRSRFDLPAEPMDKALRDFAVQAHCNVSYVPSLVAGLQAPAIKGEFAPAKVLTLLLAGTRLTAVNIDQDTIQVVEAPAGASQDATGRMSRLDERGVRFAYAADDVPAPAVATAETPTSDTRDQRDKELGEITVTGTHIRGETNLASPVEIYTRADIDATGMFTVQQFLQTLPQNFGGGASENTIGAIAGSGQTNNTVNGSAPDLRGLGTDATLVLINGHRVAPGNSDGSFVDVSMIPLTAIDRVEIVTDGASAIYGSDAVGGVVNFILRSKFEGAESRMQYGSVSTGSMRNLQAGQTFGHDWGTGSAVLSYQYFDQTALSAASRNYLVDVPLPFDLLPEQVEHALFANIAQEITHGVDLHGDLIYSHRSTANVIVAGFSPTVDGAVQSTPSRIDSYSASIGSTVALPHQSELDMTATYSESDTLQRLFATPSASPLQFVLETKSAIISLDANLDGMLASVPAGLVRYAFGAQYRKESFGNTYEFPATANTFYPTRGVDAGYLEFHVPVIGRIGGDGVDPALEMTLADRAEHYSDFGSTNNPQVGAIWKPVRGLTVRSTYGTSFKAPLLSELNPIPAQVVPLPGYTFNAAPGGTPNTLAIDGGNPDLKPEKATVWTAGVDVKPPELADLTLRLTFYDIVFRDQIAAAGSTICSCDAFVDEAIFGPEVVQRNPSAALVQQLISLPTYQNPFGVDPGTIAAIFDGRYMNLSTVKTRGLDFKFGYKFAIPGAQLDTGLDGTRILTFDDQFSSTAPTASLLNTVFNPTDLRLRGRVIVTRGPLSAGVYLNFVNAYSNSNVTPVEHVSSWTTADVVATLRSGSDSGPPKGFSVSFSILNLANRNPPFVANPSGYTFISYDGANANALGRYFSLRLQKRW